jgi:methyl-accepting chemotaxis protein
MATTLAERSALEVDGVFTRFLSIPEVIAANQARSMDGKSRITGLEQTLPLILEQYPSLLNSYVYFDKQVVPGRDYSEIWFTRDGQTIKPFHSNLPGSPNYDPNQPTFEYYNEGWYTQTKAAKGTTWTAPYVDIASKVALVSGTAPIQQDGKFIGVAGVDLSLTQVQDIVRRIHPTEHSYALLTTRNGTFVANPVWPESVLQQTIGELASELSSADLAELGTLMSSSQRGMITIIDPQTGQTAWASYQPIASTGWSIAIVIPQSDLLGSIDVLQQRVVWIGVCGLIILAFLGYLLARSIARPIRQLATATERMADGDLTTRVALTRGDEIGVLARSFNVMAESLAQRVAAEQQAQQAEAEGRQALERTVSSYLSFVEQVAAGDLSQRLETEAQGALGRLGHGLNGMVGRLQQMTNQVVQANNAIAAAAAEILAATSQQASSAAEQSAALTQTTTTIEEVKAIAQQTAHQASQIAQDSQSALQVARQGAQAVEETVGGMQLIRSRVESIAQTILALSEQSQAIGSIITTVNELADQSNLLALNAAIEAARAGEQGKSFAVVAQHVRDLAERSKLATSQVREILGQIQKATNSAVLVTEEGTKGVEAGSELAMQAGQVIHQIAGEVETGAQANVQIAAAAQQQTAGMEQVGQAMVSIQQATTQALASTRQAERAAQDLHTLAQSLQRAIAAYRV